MAILLLACTPKKEVPSEPQDAAPPYACKAVNNEACDLMMLPPVPREAGALAPEPARAVALYEQACPHCGVSCANLAKALLSGNGTPKNVTRALGLYSSSCDGGDALACIALGLVYDLGFDAPADKARAESLYRKACDAGNQVGCSNLAGLLARAAGDAPDPRVRELYEKNCAAGYLRDCSNLGVLVEGLGQTGEGKRLYEKACSGGPNEGCRNLKYLNEGSTSRVRTSAEGSGWRRID